MNTINKDISIIRELAKKQMEIAVSDRHVKMRKRFLDSNDLKIVRPPLIMAEIPWHEMNYEGELDCFCENDRLRGIEYNLRMALFQEKYFKCDNYIEPCWVVGKCYSNTGIGFEIHEERLAFDTKNSVVSHHYNDILEDESSLELYHDPVITPFPEIDKTNMEYMQEVFGDIMPVVLRGAAPCYHSPWDNIATFRGVEPILIDMYERPEYLHKIMSLFIRGKMLEIDQMDMHGLYDPTYLSLHCTPSSVTPPTEPDPTHYRCKDIWFRAMAQPFSTVSPEMHDEFDIQYCIPLASRFAYTYYGCCEPLHDRIDKLKQIPNLRKIGVSPWANVEMSAEAIGKDYVLSRKPNPAFVADTVDPAIIRAEITETVKACQKYGCPVDITLKDISTVGYKPQNLMIWAETVSAVLDEYYGEE